MSDTKATSLRLPEKLAAELAVVARADDVPMSEVVRAAIAKHIAARRADPEFQKRVREQMEQDLNVMQRLAGEEEPQKGN